MKGKCNSDPKEQDFRNILFLLGFSYQQENQIIKKLIANCKSTSLLRRIYAVLLSGQFTPAHQEALHQLGM